MWDVDANGYARGDGIAAIVLKRLSDATADGDHIECIIRETGVNQDGSTRGITNPNSDAQTALIRKTYARAGLDLNKREDRPQFFEAHGTGKWLSITGVSAFWSDFEYQGHKLEILLSMFLL